MIPRKVKCLSWALIALMLAALAGVAAAVLRSWLALPAVAVAVAAAYALGRLHGVFSMVLRSWLAGVITEAPRHPGWQAAPAPDGWGAARWQDSAGRSMTVMVGGHGFPRLAVNGSQPRTVSLRRALAAAADPASAARPHTPRH